MTTSPIYATINIVNEREVRVMLSWNEYCKIYHISKKDEREIKNLIRWKKRYLNYLKKEKNRVDK